MQLNGLKDVEVEIQRNELANSIGCVPSQINYVITSRFTPEHGYIVESRRGGGGYIRITQIKTEKSAAVKNIINAIGQKLDALSAEMIIESLVRRDIISEKITQRYFNKTSALGEKIEIQGNVYTVIGVVKDYSIFSTYSKIETFSTTFYDTI